MTTYENMVGMNHATPSGLTSAFTSTGAPLDPTHPDANPPSGGAAGGQRHGHGHGHKHGGFLKQWSKILGVDAFIETASGRGAAAGGHNKRASRNPYSRGCVTNCRDFWCDPAPVFGRRENGAAQLGGDLVNYSEMYESPALMEMRSRGGAARRGAYEAVAAEEV